MLLSDREIRDEMHLVPRLRDDWTVRDKLVIEPLDDHQFQPASVDLRLGAKLCKLGKKPFDIGGRGYLLRPRKFILGDTLEYLEIPAHLAAQVGGKSSLGRIGLQVHCTAGFVDPGFKGTLTLELCNLSDRIITLRAGQLIGQLCLLRLSRPCERPYGAQGLHSHYQGQQGPTASFETP